MLIALFFLSIPVVYLAVRIYLILKDDLWDKTECKILKFDMVKKSYGSLSEGMENAHNIYIQILYSYVVNGKTYVSKRINLGLVDRQYSKIEVGHDPFIKYLKSNKCCVYYLKKFPKISVLEKKPYDSVSNLVLLLTYVSVLVVSYAIVVLIE
ncbi:hypothetical protein C2E25_07995 [Geothermobacter hydrogeniphilus]|uniref:DUF3592 domain-containing protein n=1 Tax=Geothermobacter hydrogeniphilus TaxID=1969733 RepID=A0A2K2HAL2_9BACT|nr:hypothetical protein C2E25_07995 [Geothermobacter hydrogeniphilus]